MQQWGPHAIKTKMVGRARTRSEARTPALSHSLINLGSCHETRSEDGWPACKSRAVAKGSRTAGLRHDTFLAELSTHACHKKKTIAAKGQRCVLVLLEPEGHVECRERAGEGELGFGHHSLKE